MKLSSTPKKILLALTMLGAVSYTSAQSIEPFAAGRNDPPSQMNTVSRDYTHFKYPTVDNSAEVTQTNQGYESHPENGVLFYDAPESDCIEVLSKRTERTKTFYKRGTNGKQLFIQSSTDPMHYRDQAGNWVTIRPEILPVTGGVYRASKQINPVEINTNQGYVKIGQGNSEITYNRSLELVYVSGNTEQSLGVANWSNHTAGKDGVYVTNAWPGIDIEIYVLRGAAKTNFIVNHALPQYAGGKLLIRDHFQIGQGMSFHAATEEGFIGNMELLNTSGQKLFDITEPVAFEKANMKASFQELTYELNNNDLDIVVPGNFLNRPSSSYPVIIDPFVQATNTVPVPGSTYSVAWTVGCPIPNPVPIPSGMNITNVQWTFNYTATGGAFMNEGAVDFLVGTCRSPNLPNYYWFCNVGGGGTCTGTNISIFSDVQPCIPAPQCSYNLDVTMRFYRRWGNNGIPCSNYLVIAATPYTVTISGNTLDPGTVTASSGTVTPVCPGANVTLNANGLYGAPPLTYTWYPGGLVGQSVVVNPTATTTYTVNMADACGNITTGTVTVNVLPVTPPPTVTTPVNLCQNGPSPSLSTYVTGTNVQWYNAQTGGAPIPVPIINTGTTNTYNYWVSQTVNGCESQRVQITINVSATPPAPAVTSPVNLCQNTPPPAITTYVTGVGLTWYTVPIGGVPLGATPTISTTAPITYTYYVSQTVNGCESPRATLQITVTAQPAMPNSTTPVTYCQYSTATPLVATGTNITWYDLPSGGAPLPGAPTPNTSVVGPVTYYVTQSVNGCESQRKAILVDIIEKPQPPVVVTPVNYCQGQPAQPLSSSVTGTNIKWYPTQTATATIPMPVVNTSVLGPNTYWVSQTVNGCESDRVQIDVIVSPQPGAPAVVSPVVMCQFSAQTPLAPNVTGTNLKWYTTQTGGTGTTTEPVLDMTQTGPFTFWVSQSIGTCESPRSQIIVNINPKPAPPTAVTPVNYCQFATATALTATGQNLAWYTVPVGGTSSPTAPVPSTAVTGPQDHYVTQTVNTCESDRTQITVNINPTPAAPVVTGSPITYCQYETPAPILNSVTPSTGLVWYRVPTGGTGTTIAPVINTNIVSDTIYYVSQVLGNCEGARSPVHVIIGTSPQPPAIVTPLVYCQNDVVPPLTNSVTGTSLLWYTTPTGGIGDPNAPVVDPSIPATTYYYITQSFGNCESLRDTLQVTIHPTPALPTVVSPTEVCQYTTHTLTAQGLNLTWYTSPTGGPGNPSLNAYTQIAGDTTYWVSQTINNCEGPRQPIVITVKPKPAAPAAQTSYTYCQFESATQLTTAAASPTWYQPVNVPLPGAPTPSTLVDGNSSYFVTETVNGCESDPTEIKILVHPKPGLPVVQQITLCQDDAIPVLSAVGQNLLWYTTATGGTGSPTTPIPTTGTTGVQEYYVSQTINNCEGDRALIRVTVNPKVEASIAVSNDKACTGEEVTVTFTGSGPVTSIYDWDFDGADEVTGAGAGPYIAVWDTDGDKNVTVTITNLNCSASASINVNVQSRPKAHFDVQKDVCMGEIIHVQTDYDLMSFPQFTWDFFDAQVLDGSGYGPYGVKWNTPGIKYISLQLTGVNCPSELFYDTISVHHPVAKIMHLSSNDICTADSVLFTAQAGLDYNYEWLPAKFFGDYSNSMSAWGVVQKQGYVTVNVTDRWGCSASDSIMLQPKSCCDVFLPNTFTPNGDGKNDVFRIVTQGNQEMSTFVIMDRWGKRVFETANQYEAWDGTFGGEPLDMGTYSYFVRYRCAGTKEVMEMKGDIILLR